MTLEYRNKIAKDKVKAFDALRNGLWLSGSIKLDYLLSVALSRHQLKFHPEDFSAILDDSLFNTYLPISGRKPGRPAMVQERSFSCDECGKVFHKRRKLTAHKKIHRSVKFRLEAGFRFRILLIA